MTQVNPIWAQVHTVAADGTTTFSDDVVVNGLLNHTGLDTATYTVRGAETTQGHAHQVELNFSGLTADYAGTFAAFDATTTSDTSSRNYTGKLRGVMGHVIVQSVGAAITKTESGAFVTLIQPEATGSLGDAYCVSGELIYSATGAFTISNIQGVKGTLNVGAAGNIDQGWGVWGAATTDLGSTGTFTTLAVGVYGIMQHNSAQAVNRATGGQLFVDLTGTGSVTTNAYGINAYVQSASSSSVAGTVAGVNAAANWGSSATVTSIYGLQSQYTITGGATITNAEGLHVLAPSVSSGTLSKGRGVRIADMSNANTTTAEGLRIDNQSRAGSISIVTGGGLHQFVPTANVGSALTISDGTTTLYKIDTRNTVSGVVGHQFAPPAMTVTAAGGTIYSAVSLPAFTYGTTGTTTITALNGLALNIGAPTISAASAQTTTTASTVYIAGAPIAGGAGPSTITASFALHVVGALKLEATVANGAVATALSSVGPTGAATTVQEWLKVVTANGTRYIPCF